MESQVVSVIVQAGAVGLAGVSLWILSKVVIDVMPQMTQAINALSTNIALLIEIVKDLKGLIEKR